MPKLGVIVVGPKVDEKSTPGVCWLAIRWLNCAIVISVGKN